MPRVGPSPPPGISEPKYISAWRRPLFSLIEEGWDAKVTEDSLKEALKEDPSEDMKKHFPEGLKWIAPAVIFVIKRNILELGGSAALVIGAGSFVLSLLKPLLKWGGLVLLGLGAVGAVAGKIFSIKAGANTENKTEDSGEPETSASPPNKNGSPGDSPGLASAGAH